MDKTFRTKVLGALSLGLCLAALEARQYATKATNATQGEGGSLSMLAVAVFVALAFAAVFVVLRRVRGRVLLVATFAVLTALQSLPPLLRITVMPGSLMPALQPVMAAAADAYSAAFVLLAVLMMRAWGSGSVKAFIAAFGFSGAVQLMAVLLRPEVTEGIVTVFPLASLLSFALFLEGVPDWALAADAGSPRSESDGTPGDFSVGRAIQPLVPVLVLGLFLAGALLVATFATTLPYRAEAGTGLLVQLFGALGSLGTALILGVFQGRFLGIGRVALAFLVSLVALIATLFVSVTTHSVYALLALCLFHRLAYGTVYYLAWALCSAPLGRTCLEARFVTAFLALRLGWVAGMVVFLRPILSGGGSSALAVGGCGLAIAAIDIVFFARLLQGLERRSETTKARGVSEVRAGAASSAAHTQAAENRDESSLGDCGPEPTFEDTCRTLARCHCLTPRESEVLLLLAKGRTAPYIMREMVLSDGTVRTHIYHVYKKLGVHSQQELIDMVDEAQRFSTS